MDSFLADHFMSKITLCSHKMGLVSTKAGVAVALGDMGWGWPWHWMI